MSYCGIMLMPDFRSEEVCDVSEAPKDKSFVLGDNRQNATNSRAYGLIDKKDERGIAFQI